MVGCWYAKKGNYEGQDKSKKDKNQSKLHNLMWCEVELWTLIKFFIF